MCEPSRIGGDVCAGADCDLLQLGLFDHVVTRLCRTGPEPERVTIEATQLVMDRRVRRTAEAAR